MGEEITLAEVQRAVKRLQKGKAVGVDGLMNEVFKYGGEVMLDSLCKLFNFVFRSEKFPLSWARGLIVPLFKGGSEEAKYDPGKYRNITLLSVLGKTYTSILNERLSNWVEQNNVLVEEQAGFRKGRSTIDQLLILTELIRHRRPKKTYCAFLDIQKAYDRVWRQGLWYVLHKYGIRGRLWRVLKNLYAKVESCVMLGNEWTEFFEILVGLRQGCLLSPMLFDIFINGLAEELIKLGLGVQCGGKRICLLMFADDIVIIADTKKDLEAMLNATFDYSLRWRFKFNIDKCAVVIFDNKATVLSWNYGVCEEKCSCGRHYRFGTQWIKEVQNYKYLGIELDKKLSFKDFKARMLDKARRNMLRIWYLGIRVDICE